MELSPRLYNWLVRPSWFMDLFINNKLKNEFDFNNQKILDFGCGIGSSSSLPHIAYRGLLVRHLVMPENISDTDKVLEFIANEVSKDTILNVMSQYYPAHKSYSFPELSRRISKDEYNEAVKYAKELGMTNFMAT